MEMKQQFLECALKLLFKKILGRLRKFIGCVYAWIGTVLQNGESYDAVVKKVTLAT